MSYRNTNFARSQPISLLHLISNTPVSGISTDPDTSPLLASTSLVHSTNSLQMLSSASVPSPSPVSNNIPVKPRPSSWLLGAPIQKFHVIFCPFCTDIIFSIESPADISRLVPESIEASQSERQLE